MPFIAYVRGHKYLSISKMKKAIPEAGRESHVDSQSVGYEITKGKQSSQKKRSI